MSRESIHGFLAAVSSPLLGVVGFTIWGQVWPGHPFMLNCFKACVATPFFAFTIAAACANGWDTWERVDSESVGWLMLSSLLGIIIGDSCWLRAQQLISTHEVILMDALKPAMMAFLGWIFFWEGPTLGWFGALLTVLAVTWVAQVPTVRPRTPFSTLEGQTDCEVHPKPPIESQSTEAQPAMEIEATDTSCSSPPLRRALDEKLQPAVENQSESSVRAEASARRLWGYSYAMLNVLLDSIGSVMTRQAGSALQAWDIAGVRFGFAAVVLLLVVLSASAFVRLAPRAAVHVFEVAMGIQGVPLEQRFYHFPKLGLVNLGWMCLAILFTTYLCSILGTYALFRIDLFYVATLGATAPIWALLISTLMRRERASWQKWVGSVIAVLGVVFLVYFSDREVDE